MKEQPRDLNSPGGRITAKRKDRRLSQAGLAEASGITQSHISQIERNARSPNLGTLQALAKALRCRVGELVDSRSHRAA